MIGIYIVMDDDILFYEYMQGNSARAITKNTRYSIEHYKK